MEIRISPFAVQESDNPNNGRILWTLDAFIGDRLAFTSNNLVENRREALEEVADKIRRELSVEDIAKNILWREISSDPADYRFPSSKNLVSHFLRRLSKISLPWCFSFARATVIEGHVSRPTWSIAVASMT